MKIVMMNNGLANQIFQYIFGRGLEIAFNEEIIFDDTYFYIPKGLKHANGTSAQRYQLKEVFDIDVNLLSNYMKKEVWEQHISIIQHSTKRKIITMPQLLRSEYKDMQMVAESPDYKFGGPVVNVPYGRYDPIVFAERTNAYYHGYWICKDWLEKNKTVLLKELKFREMTEEHNLNYAKQIQETNSVAIHIRKFKSEGYNWEYPNQYYRDKIIELNQLLDQPVYFIFSDVIESCKKDYKELGFDLISDRIVFIEGNEQEGLNYRDLQLMSMCKNMILCYSSFSYLAALLNQNENKLIINPEASRKI